jgi:thiamine-phosphate pyrophosphorylase
LPGHSNIKIINRIIDANINRTKEGLRVCEEIARFLLNSPTLTSGFKKIRHKLDSAFRRLPKKIKLIEERDSLKDVGKNIYINELKRRDFKDIFFANIARVKESIRVLEEFSKLKNKGLAVEFKDIRYRVYEIEKKTAKKLSALRHYR